MDEGPCDICRELSSFGALGTPCTPMSCQCICHRRSRVGIKKLTDKAMGPGASKIARLIKAGGGLNIHSQKFGNFA